MPARLNGHIAPLCEPPGDDLDALRKALAERAEEVAIALLGKPNRAMSSRRELRFGRRGSLSIALVGEHIGHFFDHEAGAGGDMLGLVMREQNCDFAGALAWARGFLRWPEPETGPPVDLLHPNSIVFATGKYAPPVDPKAAATAIAAQEAAKAAMAAKREREEAEERARTGAVLSRVKRFWDEAETVEWTPAEVYLVEIRKIVGVPGFPASAVRFHAGERAVLVAATDDGGKLVGIQLIRLSKDGKKLADGQGKLAKQSYGPVGSGVVRLPARPDCRHPEALLLAEGPETGLTTWAATGCETWVTLGSMAKRTPPTGRLVVVCRDDDDPRKGSEKSAGGSGEDDDGKRGRLRSNVHFRIRKAVAGWRAQGLDVAIADPFSVRRMNGADFNDLAQEAGMAAVRERIEGAILLAQAVVEIELPAADEARAMVERQVDAAFNLASRLALLPPTRGVKADVGLAKSAAALRAAVRLLSELRASGSKSIVALFVPEHRLSSELARRFHAASGGTLRAAVWRGREALNPDSDGERMCQNILRVREAQKLALDPRKTVCEAGCPFRDGCAYIGQQVAGADLLILAHQGLFGPLPKPLRRRSVAMAVVDESMWQSGLVGVGGERLTLPLDALVSNAVPVPHGLSAVAMAGLEAERYAAMKAGDRDEVTRIDEVLAASRQRQAEGERLTALRHGLHAALLAHGLGALRRDVLVQHSPFDARAFGNEGLAPEACGLEWSRKVDGELDAEDGDAGEIEVNRTIRAMDWLWQGVGALLWDEPGSTSGWVELVAGPDGGRLIVIRGRRAVHEHFAAPTLLIDANLDETLTRHYWPNIVVGPEIAAATPHMRVRQCFARSFGKSMIVPLTPKAARKHPAEASRRLNNLDRLRRFIIGQHRRRGGRTLVIANKAVTQALIALGLPAGIELAWFGVVRGRDGWGDVSTLIVVGRPMPPPIAVEDEAMALTGRAVTRVKGMTESGWYQVGDVQRLVQRADGLSRVVTGEGPVHADETVERCRQQVADGGVLQAVGRARGVNRTSANPVEIIVLSDTTLPMPVEELDPREVMCMDPVAMQLAEGCVATESATDAAQMYPKLWQTPKAAEHAFQRGAGTQIPISILYRDLGSCSFRYQLPGKGQKPKGGCYDPSLVPDPRGWLESRLGPLAMFEIVAPDPPNAPAFLPGDDAPPHESAEPTPELSIDERPWPDYPADQGIDDLSPNLPGLTAEQADEIAYLAPLEADWPPERDPDAPCTGANGLSHGMPALRSGIVLRPARGSDEPPRHSGNGSERLRSDLTDTPDDAF